MKSNTNIAIICFSTITVIFASKSDTSAINIPSFIKICNQTDPQLGNCIRNSIITLRPYLNRGIPELNVPSLEPLFVDEIKIEQTGNGMELSAAFKNITLSGVTRFRLRSVRTNITTGKFRMKVWFPNLVLNATYELRGKLLMMPLNGKGACFGNFTDIDGVLSMKINRVERNSQQYYQIDFISSEFNIGSGNIFLENLFNGEQELTNSMNKFINENWRMVTAELRPTLEKTISKKVKEVAEIFFENYSISQLFI